MIQRKLANICFKDLILTCLEGEGRFSDTVYIGLNSGKQLRVEYFGCESLFKIVL